MIEAQPQGVGKRSRTFGSYLRKATKKHNLRKLKKVGLKKLGLKKIKLKKVKLKKIELKKIELSPFTKVTLNALMGRDAYQLNPRERKVVKMMPVFERTLRVPASCFRFRMIGRRPESNILSFDRSQISRVPLMENDIFLFIDEIVRLGAPYKETILYGKLFSGKLRKLVRKGVEDPLNRLRIGSDEEFKSYYDRCLVLADSIAKHGILNMQADDGYAQAHEFGHDRNMLVAIDEHGELIHWRMAKHRLAIALALDVKSVPINVGLLSGQWLLAVAGRSRLLRPDGLKDAITLALDEAERRANAGPAFSSSGRRSATIGRP